MSILSEVRPETAPLRGRLLLKLATVVVPLALLLAVILVGHFLQHALRSTAGMLALLAVASPAVVLF